MDRNLRPGNLRRAEESPGSSPGGVRPAEEINEHQPLPKPRRQSFRNELTWADFMQVLPPYIRIHAQTIYDTLRRLDAGQNDYMGNPNDANVNVQAYRLALRHVNVALTPMIAEIFFPDLFQSASRRGVINQTRNRLIVANVSSLL